MNQVPVQYDVKKAVDAHARMSGHNIQDTLLAFQRLQYQMFATSANFKMLSKSLEKAARGKHWTDELKEFYEQVQLDRQKN